MPPRLHGGETAMKEPLVHEPHIPMAGNKNMYAIRDIPDDGKKRAMLRLMRELHEGRRSGEDEGYISSYDIQSYFHGKRP